MAIAATLLGLVTNLGLPVLTKILQGDKAGAIDTVVKRVADELGVPDAQAIENFVTTDPENVGQILQTIEADYAEIARAASDATVSYHTILNADQKSESILARSWRPLNGILFGFECAGLVAAFIFCMATDRVDVIATASSTFGFLGTVLTAHAGVVGVYTWRRTTEKTAGQY